MSVNIFGSSDHRSSSGTNQKYVDEKFATLTINVATKVNASGDRMTGNLNMGNNKIVSTVLPKTDDTLTNKLYVDSKCNTISNLVNSNVQLKLNKTGDVMSGELNMKNNRIISTVIPNSDEVLTNKAYVDSKLKSESIIAKLYIDALLSKKLERNIEADLDMNSFTIYNVGYPIDSYDAANKLYVQICLQKDDITVEKLLKIGTIIEDLFDKHKSEISINKYRELFIRSMKYIRTMDTKYKTHFDDYTDENVTELLKSCVIYQDIKVLLVLIIENLPLPIFLN